METISVICQRTMWSEISSGPTCTPQISKPGTETWHCVNKFPVKFSTAVGCALFHLHKHKNKKKIRECCDSLASIENTPMSDLSFASDPRQLAPRWADSAQQDVKRALPSTVVCHVNLASSSTWSWMGWGRGAPVCPPVLGVTTAHAHPTSTPAPVRTDNRKMELCDHWWDAL